MDLDCHFVRQKYLVGLISLYFIPLIAQIADVFTKPLSGLNHRSTLGKLGVVPPPSNLSGGCWYGIFKFCEEWW